MPSQTKENYLKAIFIISQKNTDVSITELANKMEVSKPTANNMVKKMQEIGWLNYEKYKPIQLTAKGKIGGALIVRKHRLTEMFLSQVMGFGWEEVHDIAEQIEHIKSPSFFDRMDEILGFPKVDPHGSPIPDKEGVLSIPNYRPLSSLKVGETGKLSALSKSSKELLLFLNKKNIQLGTSLTILHVENFDKSIEVLLSDSTKTLLTNEVGNALLVEVG